MYGRMIDERAIGERYGVLRDQLDERGRRPHAAALISKNRFPECRPQRCHLVGVLERRENRS
jgi:hypothetical protein